MRWRINCIKRAKRSRKATMMTARPTQKQIDDAYALARERYAALGVDTDAALARLAGIRISLNCWQGDDVRGYEPDSTSGSSAVTVTGGYPGRARTADELRQDADKAYSLIPGKHRFNLHAIYAETGGARVERTAILPEHFAGWVDWARAGDIGLDMNPTLFNHRLADGGFTLSNHDASVRQFWIEHCIATRHVSAYIGRELGTPCVNNIWIPDGFKDTPYDRLGPRQYLKEALDAIFAEQIDARHNLDAVEGKLFGIGTESYTVGSHEFYFGYAVANRKLVCLDSGHFHPTESMADKLSSYFLFLDRILLHVSRGVRWDSDHVVTLNDDLNAIMQELVRGDFLERTHIGLDFFDASINRVAAWVIGARNALKALLLALLEPAAQLRALEREGNYTARLGLLEEIKVLPFGAVWDYHCARQGVPVGAAFIDAIADYEREVLLPRG